MTIRIRISRHHHVAVELCPSSEESSRGLRGNYTLTGGTTTWPSWNYALALRHHHDPPWNYVLLSRHHQELSLRGSMELRPADEAPPRSLTTRVLELCPTHTLYMPHPPIKNFHNINIMYEQQIMKLMPSNSYPTRQHTISTSNSHINHGNIPQPTK